MSKLSLVGTPIGNLKDITLRALEVLAQADVVACEDTRVTRKLLSHFSVKTPTVSFHEHSDERKIKSIIELLESGKHVALVSDAGMPAISDPGSVLVDMVRNQLPETTIEVIPGPSSVTSIVALSGVRSSEFIFLGFAPHKKGRQTFFSSLTQYQFPVVFFESPHRILKMLQTLITLGDVRVIIGRELTKMHEEVVSGTPQEVMDYFMSNQEKIRGEFVVMVTH